VLHGAALLLALALLPAGPAAGGLRAGAAAADITPPTGHPMWGYAVRRDAPSDGVLDPLKARALVLEAGGERVAFVSLDLGRAPTRASVASLRERVRKSSGVSPVFLVASHTHHGPVLELDDWPTPQAPYVRRLEDTLCGLIAEAARGLRPARLAAGSREVGLNRNRHSKRPDPPVDRELLVLKVEGEDGKPIALAVNFAAHATMTEARRMKFSADWPGAMAAAVEKATGAPCLFLQGAAGDLSPNPPGEPDPAAFGRAVAREALALAGTLRCEVPRKPALAVREEDFTFRPRIDLGNPAVFAGLSRAFFPGLIAFYEREYRGGVRPHLVVALLDGRVGFVGVSGEFFCGHALALKRRARLEHLFFLGYCNDYQQYFPTVESAAEGGYGTEPYIAPAEVGAGERVMDRALIHLYRMRGKLRDAVPEAGPGK
jgi:hypothetical protein